MLAFECVLSIVCLLHFPPTHLCDIITTMNWMGGAKFILMLILMHRARMKKYLQDKKKKQQNNITGSVSNHVAIVNEARSLFTYSKTNFRRKKTTTESSVSTDISIHVLGFDKTSCP